MASGQINVVLSLLLILNGHNGGCYWLHHCATVTTSVPDAFSGLCQLMPWVLLKVVWFLRVESLADFFYVGVSYRVCFLLLGSDVATNVG